MDSEVSCHTIRKSLVLLIDGSFSFVPGQGVVHPIPSSSFKLNSIIYVPKFHITLLSISKLTKKFNSAVIFFPSHCVFQDLHTKRMIRGGLEQDGLYC